MSESILYVLEATGLASSASEARRLLAQGAVRVNGSQVTQETDRFEEGANLSVGWTREAIWRRERKNHGG